MVSGVVHIFIVFWYIWLLCHFTARDNTSFWEFKHTYIAYRTLFSISSYRNCYTPLSLILCSHLLQFDPFEHRSPLQLFQCTLLAFMPLHLLLCTTALLVDIVGE